MIVVLRSGNLSSTSSSTIPRLMWTASGMCDSSNSSFSRTSTITASLLFVFAAASVGEISVIVFFASATKSWNPFSSIPEMYPQITQIPADFSKREARYKNSNLCKSAKSVDELLFVAQRFDGVERGSFARRIEAEENSDRGAEHEGDD